jgi:subtilisin family serine protease
MKHTIGKVIRVLFVISITGIFLPAQGGAPAERVEPSSIIGQQIEQHGDRFEEQIVIVQLKPQFEKTAEKAVNAENTARTGLRSLDGLFDAYAVQRLQPLAQVSGAPRLYKVELGPGVDPREAARNISQDPHVAIAEPNFIYSTTYIPDDPFFQYQWGLHNPGGIWGNSVEDADIDAPEAWDIEQGDPGIIIAIIDTGVNWSHADLAANIWSNPGEIPDNGIDDDNNGFIDDIRGWDFVTSTYVYPGEDGWPEDNNPDDFHGHGTHVAGISAAVGSNGYGISGVCPNCTIMPVRAGFKDQGGGGTFYLSDIVNAIYYAASNGARIINMSFGGWDPSQMIEDALHWAYEQDVVLIAAAGNRSCGNFVLYPAAYDEVIAVAATNHLDQRASFSSSGVKVDFAAPGYMIYGPVPPVGFTYMSGTSMSAPMAAGAAGLVLSNSPNLTNEQVRSALVSSADWIPTDEYLGSGRLNAYQALLMDNVPLAAVKSPSALAFLTGYADLRGTAAGTNFNRYILDYGESLHPQQWTQIYESFAPVPDGTLAVWDTSQIPNGEYLLRLRVQDSQGNTSLVLRPVYVQHNLLPNWPIDIGAAEVLLPLIADVDGDGTNEIVATSHHQGIVYVWRADGSDLPGWPIDIGYYARRGAAAADLTGDGKLEIVVSSLDFHWAYFTNYLYVFRHDGSLLPGWPIEIGKQGYMTPALGDVTGDGQMEIIVSTDNDQGENGDVAVFVYSLDGSILSGWPKKFTPPVSPSENWTSGPVLGDLNGDGVLDIVLGMLGGRIQAWDGRGNLLPGWPQYMNPDLPLEERGAISLVLGDVTGDGSLEVAATNNRFEARVWNSKGDLLPGWPFLIPNYAVGPPALADLTGDGKLEIIAHSNNDYVYAWRYDGSLAPGWPVKVQERPGNSTWYQPIVADVNGDGRVDVLWGSDERRIYAFQHDGSSVPGWFYPMWHATFHTPAVGDITGDGMLELVAGAEFFVYAWKLNISVGKAPWPMFQRDPSRSGRYEAAAQPPPAPTPTPTPTAAAPQPTAAPPTLPPPLPSATPPFMPQPTLPSPGDENFVYFYIPLMVKR